MFKDKTQALWMFVSVWFDHNRRKISKEVNLCVEQRRIECLCLFQNEIQLNFSLLPTDDPICNLSLKTLDFFVTQFQSTIERQDIFLCPFELLKLHLELFAQVYYEETKFVADIHIVRAQSLVNESREEFIP